MLRVEAMVPDLGDKWAIEPRPAVRCAIGRNEVQAVAPCVGPVQGQLCGNNRLRIGRVIDRTVVNGRKLCAITAIENNAVHTVRELVRGATVQYNVAHRNFPRQRLTARLRVDDVGQPIQIVRCV